MTDYQPPKVGLTPDEQALCKKTLKFLHELGPEIEKLRAAGIDTSAWEQLRTKLIEVNTSIGTNFCK